MAIEINPETVCFLIDRAHEFQTAEGGPDMVDTGLDVADEDFAASPLETAEESNPVYSEMVSTIGDLEPDQQVCLVALMWLGRGDYSLDEWGVALEAAGQAFNNRTADYLISTPLLGDYLQEGLSLHGYTCED